MEFTILICAVIIIVCIAANKISMRFGVPTLLLFIVLGMLFGSDGIFKIPFDNYGFAGDVCSIALIFIMFYGGFGTNWKAARPVAGKAVLLSTAGVVLTAAFTGLFCYLVLRMEVLESFLIGSVISSTDAASVFYILRSKKLNLKGGVASLLEIESGSNDPIAYLLVMVVLSLMSGPGGGSVWYLLFSQIVYGGAIGFAVAVLGVWVLQKVDFKDSGIDTIFVVGIALLAYAMPAVIGGNGYLSVYICGIILGNSKIMNKVPLVHFFDGVTNLMQIVVFFLLGLLSFPSQLPAILPISIAVALFLTFIARPATVFALLLPFRVPFRQQLLISWAGLRGAAAIVFAIFITVSKVTTSNDIFHIVFCVSLLSVAFQGTLLPVLAKKWKLIDDTETVLKTFNDYQDESDMTLVQMYVCKTHLWNGKTLNEIKMLSKSLIVMIKRDGDTMIPKGDTVIQEGDLLIINCEKYQTGEDVQLTEITVDETHPWKELRLRDIAMPDGVLVMLIKRNGSTVIPKGDTVVHEGDVLVLNSGELPVPMVDATAGAEV